MFHNRVRPRADQRLSAIVISDCEDRLLGRPLTDLDDLRAMFRVSDRPSMDVQPVSDVCVHRYLLQLSQCLPAMAAGTDPGLLAPYITVVAIRDLLSGHIASPGGQSSGTLKWCWLSMTLTTICASVTTS
jgi:hypothetical protein